jgi:hypothetical protein
MEMLDGHAEWTYSSDMQHLHVGQNFRTNMQHGNATKKKQHGQAAGTYSRDMQHDHEHGNEARYAGWTSSKD